MRIIHRRNIDLALMHEIIIRDHDPRERPQEHSISVHKSEESLNAKGEVSSVEPTRDWWVTEGTSPSKDLPWTKCPSAQKRTNDLPSPDVDVPG
jgi:hypothetical protein